MATPDKENRPTETDQPAPPAGAPGEDRSAATPTPADEGREAGGGASQDPPELPEPAPAGAAAVEAPPQPVASAPPTEPPVAERDLSPRWVLMRDLVVFQGKLALDGLRDLLLSPVSMGLALVGLIAKPDDPGAYFYRLQRFGRQTDRWINLFGAGADRDGEQPAGRNVDEVVDNIEDIVRRSYEQGGLTASAKSAIDKVLDKIERREIR